MIRLAQWAMGEELRYHLRYHIMYVTSIDQVVDAVIVERTHRVHTRPSFGLTNLIGSTVKM